MTEKHERKVTLEEFDSDLSELCVGENILLLCDPLCAFLAQLIQLRLQQGQGLLPELQARG